jgi:hypothetical protein
VFESQEGGLDAIGIDTKLLIASWTEGFTFEIGEITVTGNTASVELTLTCKQLYSAISSAQNIVMNDESIVNLTEEELTAKVAQTIMDELAKAKPVTTSLTVPFEKTGGVWAEGAAAESLYMQALLGDSLG